MSKAIAAGAVYFLVMFLLGFLDIPPRRDQAIYASKLRTLDLL